MIRQLPRAPGSYLLVLSSQRRCCLKIGQYEVLPLAPGYYYYSGSAFGPGGLAARVGRHLRRSKTKHWHIDYLRPWCRIERVCCTTAGGSYEHLWSVVLSALPGMQAPLPGFGASDCSCSTHLHYYQQPLADVQLQETLSGVACVEVAVIIPDAR